MLPRISIFRRKKFAMPNRQQSTFVQAQQALEQGSVVIFWRPGCPFCERLDAGLGDDGDSAVWVNIWEDSEAEEFVKSVNQGNAVVPTVSTAQESFVASASDASEVVRALIKKASV